MNAEKYTKNSIKAIEKAQSLAAEYGNSELTTLHLAAALSVNGGTPFRMLKKAECDAEGFSRAVTEELRRLPRVSGSGVGMRTRPLRFAVCFRRRRSLLPP